MLFGNCRNPDRGVESLAALPIQAVINNSNALGLMRSPNGIGGSDGLARFPLFVSGKVL
jgi:hypothetical protein